MIKLALHKFSLSQALVVMIVISLILPLPLVLLTYVNSAYKSKQEVSATMNIKKFNLSSEIFAESLWNYYPEIGQKLVNQLLLDPNLLSILVKDSEGNIFLQGKSHESLSDNDTLILHKTIEQEGLTIGSLEMSFKKEGILESVISDVALFGTLVALQIFFLIIVVSFVYYYKIIKPIKRLMCHSSLLSEQKLDKPFKWDNSDEIGSLGVALERTRIKLKELFQALKKENETLDEKVQQRTKELEDASRYKSEFLANMSHEIRTPMNAIMGMSHLMSKTAMNKTQANYIHKIKDSSSILLHIINDILDFSKIEAGKMEVEDCAFDLHQELIKSCSIFSVLAKEKNIEFSGEFIHTHRFFRGDSHKIMQIINNFLSNAIKFTTQGSVVLSVEEHFDETNKRSTLTFGVKDNGIGIPKEKQALLFKAFGQLDASITRKHGGTGLGLYICTQLAGMLNGAITVESEENQGSLFSFTLSLPRAKGLDIQNENATKSFVPLHILLVEDDSGINDSLSEIIRSFGFFLTCKKSHEDITTHLLESSKAYNLLIIDQKLLKNDILKLYKKIKATVPPQKLPPTLLLMEKDDEEVKNALCELGLKSFLKNPINPSMLYDEIVSLCDVLTNKPIFDPSRIDLSQKRILIVEDNDINLEVAIYLLKDTDAKIEVAKNGIEAVDWAKNSEFDLILMDIQMPLMDGYEATRIMRKELHVTTPIIAMTANVMVHDIEKCIVCGMDFHIGKPFEVEDFYGTLLEALHVSLLSPKQNTIKEKMVKIFDKQEAIHKLGSREDLWKKIFRSFYEQYSDFPAVLKTLMGNEKKTLFIDYIHTLKGLSGMIGGFAFQKKCAKVESVLSEKGEISETLLQSLLKEHKTLFALLSPEYERNELLEHKAEQPKNETSEQEIVALLNALQLALESSNVSKVNLSLDNLSLLDTIGNHTLFKSIILSCSMFDFEASLITLERLKEELHYV